MAVPVAGRSPAPQSVVAVVLLGLQLVRSASPGVRVAFSACYEEPSADRPITAWLHARVGPGFTVGSCARACAAYRLMALQGGECFCSDALLAPGGTRRSRDACGDACPREEAQPGADSLPWPCGLASRAAVYQLTRVAADDTHAVSSTSLGASGPTRQQTADDSALSVAMHVGAPLACWLLAAAFALVVRRVWRRRPVYPLADADGSVAATAGDGAWGHGASPRV